MKIKRAIIEVDTMLCNGCGVCIHDCPEGALQLTNGKVRLTSDAHCDGLGGCMSVCPMGALHIIEREAYPFTNNAAYETAQQHVGVAPFSFYQASAPLADSTTPRGAAHGIGKFSESGVSHWPIKLRLIQPESLFLRKADLLITGDCTPAVAIDFHRRFAQKKTIVTTCTKFENSSSIMQKLAAVFAVAEPRACTILHMALPCCTMLLKAASKAYTLSESTFPLHVVKLDRDGRESLPSR